MRPKILDSHDSVDSLLHESWETPPQGLEQRLIGIPAQVVLAQTHTFDRFILILNVILASWGLGLAFYFWGTLGEWINQFSENILNLSINFPGVISHPLFILFTIGCVSFGIWWLDMEKPPGIKLEP